MTAKPVEISVVVPCWNVEPYLARCLESVFAALPANAEVLAVDDGSTDGTLAILESSAKSAAIGKVRDFCVARSISRTFIPFVAYANLSPSASA